MNEFTFIEANSLRSPASCACSSSACIGSSKQGQGLHPMHPTSSREPLCGLPAVNPPLAVCSYITQAACNQPCHLPK